MYKIINPDEFKTIPWKNGQGVTTELAISPGGTLADFDWRLSIASVVENGVFSDFTGYDRQLVLLNGNGMRLSHDDSQVDELTEALAVAAFDGGSRTVGTLLDGPIQDFNVMTKQGHYQAELRTYTKHQTTTCSATQLTFIYTAQQLIELQVNQQHLELPQGHLLQLSNEKGTKIQLTGQGFMVVLIQSQA